MFFDLILSIHAKNHDYDKEPYQREIHSEGKIAGANGYRALS